MNEKLKSYIDKKEAELKTNQALEKEKFLIKEGLFEKVYSENNEFSNEYPFYEWDPKNQVSKYYKKIPIEVTDEEYEQIKKYQDSTKTSTSNLIAKTLKIIAIIIFIAGFIAGIVLGNQKIEGIYRDSTEFSFTVAFTYWAVSFISGMMFLGFAEIIQLLQDIKNKK